MTAVPIESLAINTIRTLSMDAVQAANSGHPGTPMGIAPVAYAIWQNHLRYDPNNPLWTNRDRFILSAGHASMLLYSLLFLTGVKQVDEKGELIDKPTVSLDDIKHFRQIGSRTPGHPEYHHTTGVETTTGPLGQGIATSVGFAMAEEWLAARYNRPGHVVYDNRTYVICGDGDLMEGISREAGSLAGHLKLSNLCWIYDSNQISIEGSTDLAFTEDTAASFAAYGWAVEHIDDANDTAAVDAALTRFQQRTDKPTFIVVRSKIGFGSPHKQGTKEAHGEPLGDEEIKLTKAAYGWPVDEKFYVPDGVIEHFKAGIGARGAKLSHEWAEQFSAYSREFPEHAAEIGKIINGELPDGWDVEIPSFPADAKGVASREASGKVLNAVAKNFPWLLGGAADLAPSTKTKLTFDGAGTFSATERGRNFHFGVREHAMTAAVNGLALSGLRSFGSGFLIFSDYMKPSIRLAALMKLPVIFIFTHDSIGVGEDGPTHQPIEQLLTLRSIPDMTVIRPADANEVAEAWRLIGPMKTPVALALSRQNLPTYDRTKFGAASGVAKGGYILADAPADKLPEVILIGTGSEVSLCMETYERLAEEGIAARVVSLPSWEIFEHQSDEYRESVLPKAITARVTVEAGTTLGWDRYAGPTGKKIGMTSFGESAPLKDLLVKFGFTVDVVYDAAKSQLKR